MSGRIRVLICDDHPVVRTGLRGMLSKQPNLEVVGEAENGIEAVDLTALLKPDVVLMDLRMPEMDGVAATRRIKLDRPETGLLILTTYESDTDILKALHAGAVGYLLKDAPSEELYAAIRAAAAGESALSPAVASRLVQRTLATPEEALSSRELEVLELVSRGESSKEIAKQLWIGETTVKSHLTHVYEKLGVQDRAAAVAVAMRRGILSLGPRE